MEIAQAIFSIWPEFAKLIFERRKAYELRKKRPALRPGSIVYVYATKPVQAIIGHFTVAEIISGPKPDIWQRIQRRAGLTHEAFDCYFCGGVECHALVIDKPVEWPNPFHLSEIRRVSPGFYPPQQYRFLERDELLVRAIERWKAELVPPVPPLYNGAWEEPWF